MTVTAIENMEVLIVEDSPTQAMALKEALTSRQLHVHVAKDGVEALEQLTHLSPKVVVSDIAMPRLNGFDFCRKVKQDPALTHIPVILLTSLTDPMDVIKGIACGADSFLTKPCEIDILLSTMQDVLANKKIQKPALPGQSVAFFYNGQHHSLQIDQVQITNLLLSTYLNAIQKNSELEKSYHTLSEAHGEIKQKNEELQRLNDQKNQFLGMAAHDLRNPLGVIIGYSQLLKSKLEGKTEEKVLSMIDKIHASSSFMLRLINDLLDVSVIESGKVSLRLEEVNLYNLIQDNLLFLNSIAEKKQIKLTFSSRVPMLKAVCDANKIAQVLNNLVTNAIKFSRMGSSIEVGLDASSTEATLIVKDHGMGMTDQVQKDLFRPFSKGTVGTGGEKSTGLGLAIVQKIVKEHRGKIWFESAPGLGSTFFVSIPCLSR